MNLRNRREKLIYLAAIIDGDGSIGMERLAPCKVTRKGKESWQRKKYYYTCRLCVINTDEKLIKWIHQEFGGSFYERSSVNGRKLCYCWHILGDGLGKLLLELEPFLFIKKSQAHVLLKYRETVGKTGFLLTDEILEQRKQLWLQCISLNKTGT